MSKLQNLSDLELKERNSSLQKTKIILDKLNILFFLEGGVFLGAVREKNFINWDWDIELAVFTEKVKFRVNEILNEFDKNNFKILHVNDTWLNFKINVYEKKHTKISIVGYQLINDYRSREYLHWPAKFFNNNKINFLGKIYNCPDHTYLEWTYKNWKIPSKSDNQKDYYNSNVFVKRNLIFSYLLKINKFLTLILIYLNKIIRKFKNREPLFQYIIKYYSKKIDVFIDVGSNDGKESILVRKNNKNTKLFIFEIDENNILNIKKNLKKNKIKLRNVSFYKTILSDINGVKDFYFNKSRSNLNSILPKPNLFKKIVKSITLDTFIKDHGNFNNNELIFIKADIEGGEFELFNGAMNFLKMHNNIIILFELHPETYNKNERNILNIIKKLLNNNFNIRFIESAGLPVPHVFKKYNYKPFLIMNNRGLYKNISNEFVLRYAFKKTYHVDSSKLNKFNNQLYKKVIRSICISNYE